MIIQPHRLSLSPMQVGHSSKEKSAKKSLLHAQDGDKLLLFQLPHAFPFGPQAGLFCSYLGLF
jgi:hypothetical protein